MDPFSCFQIDEIYAIFFKENIRVGLFTLSVSIVYGVGT